MIVNSGTPQPIDTLRDEDKVPVTASGTVHRHDSQCLLLLELHHVEVRYISVAIAKSGTWCDLCWVGAR